VGDCLEPFVALSRVATAGIFSKLGGSLHIFQPTEKGRPNQQGGLQIYLFVDRQ